MILKMRRPLALPVIALAAGPLLLLTACGSGSGAPPSTGSSSSSGSTPGASTSASSAAFQVNTGDCTDPKAASAKVTGSWKIGYSAPLSGPVAGVVGLYFDGWKARIQAANASNEIPGIKIDVPIRMTPSRRTGRSPTRPSSFRATRSTR